MSTMPFHKYEDTLAYLGRIPSWRNANSLMKFAFIVVSHGRKVPQYQNRIVKIQNDHKVKIKIQEHLEITPKVINLQ